MNHNRYDLAPFTEALRAITDLQVEKRQTGRTHELLKSLKPGDRFIAASQCSVPGIQSRLAEMGITGVEVIYVNNQPPGVLNTSSGRTVFDHAWVEKYALERIGALQEYFQRMADMISGFDERHEATREKAKKLATWNSALDQAFAAELARSGLVPNPPFSGGK